MRAGDVLWFSKHSGWSSPRICKSAVPNLFKWWHLPIRYLLFLEFFIFELVIVRVAESWGWIGSMASLNVIAASLWDYLNRVYGFTALYSSIFVGLLLTHKLRHLRTFCHNSTITFTLNHRYILLDHFIDCYHSCWCDPLFTICNFFTFQNAHVELSKVLNRSFIEA